MSAAVLNRGRRPNDHPFARLLPKPQGIDRLHDRLEYSRGNPAGKNALTNLFASAIVSLEPASSESSVSSAEASPMSSRAL